VVGTVKTNVGHSEAASGVIGVIKAVLSLQHKTIPQHLHLQSFYPHFPSLDGKIFIPNNGPHILTGPFNAGNIQVVQL
jgi:acyl transferase domain-containing protein